MKKHKLSNGQTIYLKPVKVKHIREAQAGADDFSFTLRLVQELVCDSKGKPTLDEQTLDDMEFPIVMEIAKLAIEGSKSDELKKT